MLRKNIIITAGPTNEPIDQVMQITNMSSGKLGAVIADSFLRQHSYQVGTLYYVCHKRAVRPETADPRVEIVPVETTNDLLREITDICGHTKIDIIVHSAAVGDYTGKYVARMEDIAEEIWTNIQSGRVRSAYEILGILRNPGLLCDSSTKISSYEPNLMCAFGLTEKVISHLRELAPEAKIAGFKLLDNVSEEELRQTACRLMEKNDINCIVANDLSRIGNGKHEATFITKGTVEKKCDSKQEIAEALGDYLFR